MVLFLCTGNYYRSRFAEIVFNSLAQQCELALRADSRGLELSRANKGPVSPHARLALQQMGIELPAEIRYPIAATLDDFQSASHVVAVKEAEHRPLLERHFPTWAGAVEYWHVDDVDCATPEESLPQLLHQVRTLMNRLDAELRMDRAG